LHGLLLRLLPDLKFEVCVFGLFLREFKPYMIHQIPVSYFDLGIDCMPEFEFFKEKELKRLFFCEHLILVHGEGLRSFDCALMLTAICPFSSCFHKEGCLYFFATALI
jgi:hypothetical protein